MKKIILVILLLFCCIIKGQTQNNVKEDFEWVANTIQKNYHSFMVDKNFKEFYPICKTDFDDNKFILFIYIYDLDNSIINEVQINFREIESAYAQFEADDNNTSIHFGNLDRDESNNYKNKIFINNHKYHGEKYFPNWIIRITNEGEDFIWKKMNEKLNIILKTAKSTN